MSSIKNIKSSTPMPPDLANKIGVGGVAEVLDVLWRGYHEIKEHPTFTITPSSEEDDITQRWYEAIVEIWASRNRATSVALNTLRPIHQYADSTFKKRKGAKAPTIDFCFKDWSTDNSYFGAEAKNLYKNRPDKIERYVTTGVDNYIKGRYGSQSSESSIIGYVLSGNIPDIIDELRTEIAKGTPLDNLSRSIATNPQYKSSHLRKLDGKEITLHHLFFDFTTT